MPLSEKEISSVLALPVRWVTKPIEDECPKTTVLKEDLDDFTNFLDKTGNFDPKLFAITYARARAITDMQQDETCEVLMEKLDAEAQEEINTAKDPEKAFLEVASQYYHNHCPHCENKGYMELLQLFENQEQLLHWLIISTQYTNYQREDLQLRWESLDPSKGADVDDIISRDGGLFTNLTREISPNLEKLANEIINSFKENSKKVKIFADVLGARVSLMQKRLNYATTKFETLAVELKKRLEKEGKKVGDVLVMKINVLTSDVRKAVGPEFNDIIEILDAELNEATKTGKNPDVMKKNILEQIKYHKIAKAARSTFGRASAGVEPTDPVNQDNTYFSEDDLASMLLYMYKTKHRAEIASGDLPIEIHTVPGLPKRGKPTVQTDDTIRSGFIEEVAKDDRTSCPKHFVVSNTPYVINQVAQTRKAVEDLKNAPVYHDEYERECQEEQLKNGKIQPDYLVPLPADLEENLQKIDYGFMALGGRAANKALMQTFAGYMFEVYPLMGEKLEDLKNSYSGVVRRRNLAAKYLSFSANRGFIEEMTKPKETVSKLNGSVVVPGLKKPTSLPKKMPSKPSGLVVVPNLEMSDSLSEQAQEIWKSIVPANQVKKQEQEIAPSMAHTNELVKLNLQAKSNSSDKTSINTNGTKAHTITN